MKIKFYLLKNIKYSWDRNLPFKKAKAKIIGICQ